MLMSRITCSELIDRGDLAVHENDRETLIRVSRLLASRMGDPLGGWLRSLARTCTLELDVPTHEWTKLRTLVRERMLIAGT